MNSASLTCLLSLVQARYFFQQLISGVSYCHYMVSLINILGKHYFLCIIWGEGELVKKISSLSIFISFNKCFHPPQQICHRDLKLENVLLDGSPAPRLKICDFGYSKVLFPNMHNLVIVS